MFYAPDREPSIDLDTKILHVTGLDDYIPALHANGTGSGPEGSFGGSDFRNAYAPGVTLTGAGQTVGLLEDEGYYVADINRYQAQFPNALPNQIPLRVITSDGFVATSTQSGPPRGGCKPVKPLPPNTPPAGTPIGSTIERSLDIEVAMAMAPGLENIYVYEGCNFDTILQSMASTTLPDGSLPQQLSASYTFGASPTTIEIVEQMAVQGQSFFVAAGDKHATCPDNVENSSRALPYTTVVGGTILTMNRSGASWKSETAATDGGGVLNGVPLPGYQAQAAANVDPSANSRMIPDVAMVSCDGSNGKCGMLVYENNDPDPAHHLGGTSVATPLWAAYIALANELGNRNGWGPLGFINPALYSIGSIPAEYARDFHDVIDGSSPPNPCPTGVPTHAAPGYDLITGLGTPTANLIDDLVAPPQKYYPPPPQCGPGERWCVRYNRCTPDSQCTVIGTKPPNQ